MDVARIPFFSPWFHLELPESRHGKQVFVSFAQYFVTGAGHFTRVYFHFQVLVAAICERAFFMLHFEFCSRTACFIVIHGPFVLIQFE